MKLSLSLALGLAASLATAFPLKARDDTVTAEGDPYLVDTTNPNGAGMKVTFMPDNTLVGAYNGMRGNLNTAVTYSSSDNARTWSPLGVVASGDPGSTDIGNVWPTTLPSGDLVVAYRNHYHLADGTYYYRLTLSKSTDGGKTFSVVTNIVERAADPNTQNGLWEPALRVARDGNLQCYFSSEANAGDQDNHMVYSTDGGQTWSQDWTPVSGLDRVTRDGMTGVADIDDNGNVICVFEVGQDGYFHVDYVTSSDDGYTWGNRRTLYQPSGKNAGAPSVANVWGTLVASVMTDAFVDHTSSGGYDGGEMRLMFSNDGANGWSVPYLGSSGGAHWGYIHNESPDEILSMYSNDDGNMLNQVFKWEPIQP